MKIILHTVFILLIALVTFLGLGPVLLADGVLRERLFYGALVVLIYIVLSVVYWLSVKWINKR